MWQAWTFQRMRAKAAFVKAVMKNMEQADNAELLTKGEKYDRAVGAWMNSSVRAVLNAGKKGVAAVTTSD